MTAVKTGANAYSGTLFQTTGPAFSMVPFNPASVAHTAVGSASLTFTDANTAQFAYTVNGMSQVKTLTRQVFGTLPTCVFSGTLYRTTGPAFSAMPFDPTKVVRTPVGMATFTFTDGNHATFAYTVNGVSQTKAITREVFVAPGTVCQ